MDDGLMERCRWIQFSEQRGHIKLAYEYEESDDSKI